MLEVKNVKKTYKTKRMRHKDVVKAVDDVSFILGQGRCVGLVGESGCGKSTLGRMISALEIPDEGQIILDGRVLSGKNPLRDKEERQKIQIVFQDSLSSADPRMSARAIVSEPLKNFFGMSGHPLENRVDELLKMVSIPLEEKDKYPFQFSGGQLQRISIARALASDPPYIILDEPLSSLDVSVQAQILNLLSDIKKKMGVSYLLISHDLEAVYYLSDAIYVMYGGRIMESIDDIGDFDKLVHPYSQKLLASCPAYREEAEAATIEDAAAIAEFGSGCPYAPRCPRATEKCCSEKPQLTRWANGHMVACYELN